MKPPLKSHLRHHPIGLCDMRLHLRAPVLTPTSLPLRKLISRNQKQT